MGIFYFVRTVKSKIQLEKAEHVFYTILSTIDMNLLDGVQKNGGR